MGGCLSLSLPSNDLDFRDKDDCVIPDPLSPISTTSSIHSDQTDFRAFTITTALEFQRIQCQYSYMSTLWGTKFSAPIEYKLRFGGCKVLDIGCGTGTWLLEMAKTYPNNLYCGIDTVPIFPLMNVPPNISFINADILDKLPFGSETFDFVHQQLLARNFNNRDWEFVINEIIRVTKPLGHIELMEMDLVPYQQGPITNKLHEAFLASMYSKGVSPTVNSLITRILHSNKNLEYVNMDTKNGPLNRWGGLESVENGLVVFKRLKKQILEFMSISSEEYDKMLNSYVEEVEQHNTFIKTHRFHAQKILAPSYTPTSASSTPKRYFF